MNIERKRPEMGYDTGIRSGQKAFGTRENKIQSVFSSVLPRLGTRWAINQRNGTDMTTSTKIRTAMLAISVLLTVSWAGFALAAMQQSFSRPGLITSIGQSSDIAIIKALLNTKLKLGLEVNPLAKASDLAGAKTLVIVLGASTKGLGAAGIDMGQEAERTKALLKAAREQGLQILAMHVGGEARRGKSTNDLIELVVPESQHVVVVASGNKDKFYNTLAAKRGIPVTEAASLAAAGDTVKSLFRE